MYIPLGWPLISSLVSLAFQLNIQTKQRIAFDFKHRLTQKLPLAGVGLNHAIFGLVYFCAKLAALMDNRMMRLTVICFSIVYYS
jgi:hypothetical protein